MRANRPTHRTAHDYTSAQTTLAQSLRPVRILLSVVFLMVVATTSSDVQTLDRGTSWALAGAAWLNAFFNSASMFGLLPDATRRSLMTLQLVIDALLALAGMLLLNASATPLAWIALLLPVFDAGVAFGALGAGLAWSTLSLLYILLKLQIQPDGQSNGNVIGLAVQQLAAVAIVVIPTAFVAAHMRDDLADAHGDRVDANRRSEHLLLVASTARRLAATKQSAEVIRIALESAVGLGFDRVEICERPSGRAWRLQHAAGSLQGPGPGLDASLEAAVERGRPLAIAVGGAPAVEELRLAGYASGVVLPLAVVPDHALVMRALSVEPLAADSSALESIQLLATLAGGAWQNAGTLADLESWSNELEYRATHDELTGLANRASLLSHLDAAVENARRAGTQVAVLFLDLDRFKRVNDTLGHDAGDAVLQGVARRLGNHVRGHDLLARLGGDEFVIVLNDLSSPEDAAAVAARICESAAAPFAVGGSTFTLSASIGITVAEPGVSTEELLSSADHQMYAAKRQGGSRYVSSRRPGTS